MVDWDASHSDKQVKICGVIRTSSRAKFDAPHQPQVKEEDVSVVELLPDSRLERALADLETFSHIWLISWFHLNDTWRAKVLPPRGPAKRRGVFATRSPHRPNPIGITAVKLIKVSGNKLYIGSHDLIDGTPIIDIKPYLPTADIVPSANSGWVGELDAELARAKRYNITLSDLAKEQLEWFEKRDINFIDRARELLSIDPSPHRTRRIKRRPGNEFRMGCGGWRLIFTVSNDTVHIERFHSGYPLSRLTPERAARTIHYEAHIEFYEEWEQEGA